MSTAAIRWAALPALKKAMFLRRLENEIRRVLTQGKSRTRAKTRKKTANIEDRFMKKTNKNMSKLEDRFMKKTGQGENEFAEMVETQCQRMAGFGMTYLG